MCLTRIADMKDKSCGSVLTFRSCPRRASLKLGCRDYDYEHLEIATFMPRLVTECDESLTGIPQSNYWSTVGGPQDARV